MSHSRYIVCSFAGVVGCCCFGQQQYQLPIGVGSLSLYLHLSSLLSLPSLLSALSALSLSLRSLARSLSRSLSL